MCMLLSNFDIVLALVNPDALSGTMQRVRIMETTLYHSLGNFRRYKFFVTKPYQRKLNMRNIFYDEHY